MTKLSPRAHAIMEAYYNVDTTEEDGIIALLRALANEVVPHEDKAPKAVFDCEPRPSYNFKTNRCDGPLRYEHGDYLRRQFDQDELNIRWEQRQQTRDVLLAIIAELEAN